MTITRKIKVLVLVSSLLLISFGSLPIPIQAAPLVWEIQTLVSSNIGGSLSLALDSNNQPHIGYRHESITGLLKYMRWTGSTWDIQDVDSSGDVGSYLSLALDSANNPHISYLDIYNYDLKYAQWNVSDWAIQTVDSDGLVGSHTSLALGSNNYAHISYYDNTNSDLKYARWTGTEWNVQTVDSNGDVGEFTSLALDSNNYAHICYHDDTNNNVKYARWNGEGWEITVIDNLATKPSIGLDSSNRPHISYYSHDGNNLNYAKWTGSEWTITIVDASNDVGEDSSIALDSNNYPHICYFDAYSADLKYATLNETSWNIKNVDSVGSVGRATSLALDSSNNPHVSYCGPNTLKYARDPDETITHHSYSLMDVDDDGYDSGIEIFVFADTTYTGAVNVSAIARMTDHMGGWICDNVSTWEITGTDPEFGVVQLFLPEDLPREPYHVGIILLDERNATEDEATVLLNHDFYPPGYGCDEYFQWWTYNYLDGNDDNNNDGVEIIVEVDTSHNDNLVVRVDSYLIDPTDTVCDSNSTSWIITSNQDDWKKISLYAPKGNPPGFYRVELRLFDEWGNHERDYQIPSLLLIPPQPLGRLEGRVTDVDTGLPDFYDILIEPGSYYLITNSSGNYGINLSPGEYNVTAEKYDCAPETVLVSIVEGSTTIQDFQLSQIFGTLSLNFDGSGNIDPPAGLVYERPFGSQINVTASPSPAWMLSHWILDGENVGSENPIAVYISGDHNLTAVFVEEFGIRLLEGRVTDKDTGLAISDADVSAVLHIYDAWTNETGHYQISLPMGDYDVTAQHYLYSPETILVSIGSEGTTVQDFTLERQYWELILEVEGAGTLEPSYQSLVYPPDTELSITASSEPGWVFSYWILDGENVGSENPITVLFDVDQILTAVFQLESGYGLLNGTITDSVTDLRLGNVNVNATSETVGYFGQTRTDSLGYYQLELPEGNYNVTTYKPNYENQTTLVNILSDTTITQDFIVNPKIWELYIGISGEGTTNPIPESHIYQEGEIIQIEATPQTGWALDYWILDTEYQDPINPFSLTMDTQHTIFAIFAESPSILRALSVDIIGSGTTEPGSGSNLFPEGTEVIIEAVPESKWTFHHWLINLISEETANPLPIIMDSNQEIIAFFVQTISDPTIESCNEAGGQKDSFEIGETIYVIGDNYPPSSTFDFYIVENIETWSINTTIPDRIPGTPTTISSNADGWIPPAVIWLEPDTVGSYDLLVDINGNGLYDPEIDALDDNDVEVTDGFVIIPEISTWIMFLTFIITTFIVMRLGKNQKRKHQ